MIPHPDTRCKIRSLFAHFAPAPEVTLKPFMSNPWTPTTSIAFTASTVPDTSSILMFFRADAFVPCSCSGSLLLMRTRRNATLPTLVHAGAERHAPAARRVRGVDRALYRRAVHCVRREIGG